MTARPCKYKQAIELIFKSCSVEPVREYRFHPTRRWRLDWAFPDKKLAVEYEGLAFHGGKSRHTSITGFSGDCEKYSELSLAGWMLIRVNAKMVQNGIAHDLIMRALLKGAAAELGIEA